MKIAPDLTVREVKSAAADGIGKSSQITSRDFVRT
jgi:hypothetical protein